MGFLDNIFGGIFDFNGDGHTDPSEMAMGLMMLDEMDKERERERKKQELINDLLRNAAQYGLEYSEEEIEEYLTDSERLGLFD